ncbi:unnamed protein product [Echinostoma caproni]|uniref:Uncharacterized protein n=1 Tax=Echinostoma caproni TaxID=27848 RepID=A0A183ASX1_9TREM|nr:unnamed protein product [Echinostoma caproni]
MWETGKRQYLLLTLIDAAAYDQIYQNVSEEVTYETFSTVPPILVPRRRKKELWDAFRHRVLCETAQQLATELPKLATSALPECDPSFRDLSLLQQFADVVRPVAVKSRLQKNR